MGRESNIAWTHATFNPWEGCEKVSEGCAHCYAEERNKRFHGGEHWGGKGTPRLLRSEAYWREPLKWNALAERDGKRWRVFCASLADVFEDRSDLLGLRDRLFGIIEQTPQLDWLLLTKRPQHMRSMLPAAWLQAPRANVWLGTTAENQRRADERIPELLATPAAVRFVSAEPLLDPLDLTRVAAFRSPPWPDSLPGEPPTFLDALRGTGLRPSNYGVSIETTVEATISWVIVGGESGPGARPFYLGWARRIVRDCKAADVPVFVKQLGAAATDPINGVAGARTVVPADAAALVSLRLKHPKGGGDMAEWPEDLRVRQFPSTPA